MTLDPGAQRLLDRMRDAGVAEFSSLTVEAARAQRRARRLPPGPAADVREHAFAGPGGRLSLRVYRPLAGPAAEAEPRDAEPRVPPRGTLVFFHGGGFVLGDLDGQDAVCRELCVGAGCAVVSVDYRLAPEHPFPAAVDDAEAATRFVQAHAAELGVDATRLAVGGDSAGGNLAAVVAAQRRTPRLSFQLLIYPVADLRSFDTASYLENATGHFLTRADMIRFAELYVPDPALRGDPRVSPLAADELAGLPPALVITAEHDPLCDEGARYAERMRQAGNRVSLFCYPGMIHGFVSFYPYLEAGKQALGECCAALSAALNS